MNDRSFSSVSLTMYFVLICFVFLFTAGNAFGEELKIEHPFKNPKRYTDRAKCDNCGMDRNKWARTRHEFQTSKGKHYTCSIHCVSVISSRYKVEPKEVMVAEYLNPGNMLQAEKAFYVVGSSAPGTMTAKSKIAFASKEEAGKFSERYGGKISDFADALAEARKGYR